MIGHDRAVAFFNKLIKEIRNNNKNRQFSFSFIDYFAGLRKI